MIIWQKIWSFIGKTCLVTLQLPINRNVRFDDDASCQLFLMGNVFAMNDHDSVLVDYKQS